MGEHGDTTQVLVEIAVLGTKIDNLVASVNSIDRKVDQNDVDLRSLAKHEKANTDQAIKAIEARKADAKEIDRRFDAQDKFNWFVGTTSVGAAVTIIVTLVRHIVGS